MTVWGKGEGRTWSMRVIYQISWEIVSPHVVSICTAMALYYTTATPLLVQFFWSTLEFNFKWLMPIWHQTQAKTHEDEYSMNQTSLKNGRHASLEITQCHPLHFSQHQASSTVLGDGDCYLRPHRKVVRQSGGWPYPYSGVEGSMQHLLHNCPPDFSKPLLPVINHNCHMLSNDHVLVNNVYTALTVNQGHRRWQ